MRRNFGATAGVLCAFVSLWLVGLRAQPALSARLCVVSVLVILWVRDPRWYLIVPTRSSRSRWQGNEPARAFDAKGCFGQLRELAGHNASERRAGSANVSRECRPSSRKGKAVVQGTRSEERRVG